MKRRVLNFYRHNWLSLKCQSVHDQQHAVDLYLLYCGHILSRAHLARPCAGWIGLVSGTGARYSVPVRIKRLYNPGLASVLFLFLPIGIYYIWYVTTNNLASAGDFVIGFFATLGAVVVLFLLPIILFRNRESKYPFSEAEMNRFAGQKS